MMLRRSLILAAAIALGGCSNGMSACERATKAALPLGSRYEKIQAREDPGETPAMTYYIIDYFVTAPGGKPMREQVHCSYWRDFGEAEPHRTSSGPAA